MIDPLKIGVQPSLVNNAWVIKKQSAIKKPWNECVVSDIRLVTGFDHLNKYLKAIPSKVHKFEDIYSSLAQWNYMGELDFKDMY